MKKVFISHPYADNPVENRAKVDMLCKKVAATENVLPVSPIHLFSFISEHDEENYRDNIMEYCKHMIADCDVVRIYVYNYRISEGQHEELMYAIRAGKEIEFVRVEGKLND